MQADSRPLSEALLELVNHGTLIGLGDGELLSRFHDSRDSRAFAALVERHATLVFAVCRAILPDPNDVEDAFQATFVVLLQRGMTVREPGRLPGWLHGVSRRIALRLKRRRRPSPLATDPPAPAWCRSAEQLEREALLHHEIDRLPEKYRLPTVLCYLEGLTHDEAAARLNWPVGTVCGRLSRARDQLRRRLERHGVSGAVGIADVLDTMRIPQQVVPEALIRETVALLGDDVPPKLTALSQGAIQAMITEKVRRTLVLTLGLVLPLAAGGVTARGLAGQDQPGAGGVVETRSKPPTSKQERQTTQTPARSEVPEVEAAREQEREAAEDRLDQKKVRAEMLEFEVEALRERLRTLHKQQLVYPGLPGRGPRGIENTKLQEAVRESQEWMHKNFDETKERLERGSLELARLKREISRETRALGRSERELADPQAIDERLRTLDEKVDRILVLMEKQRP